MLQKSFKHFSDVSEISLDCSVIYIVFHGVLRYIGIITSNILFASQILFLYLIVSQPESGTRRSQKTHDDFSRDLVWQCLGENRIGLKNAGSAGPVVYL